MKSRQQHEATAPPLFAAVLADLARWPLSVADLIQAERQSFIRLGLRAEDVVRVVDQRYAEMGLPSHNG